MQTDPSELAASLVRRKSVTPDDAGCQELLGSLLGADPSYLIRQPFTAFIEPDSRIAPL